MIAVRAWLAGFGQVLRAPFTMIAVMLLTLVAAIPFGLVLGDRLQAALNDQPPVMLGSEEIDADWWLEFRRHAEGLEATFTPAIIGFAAPLSNLSDLVDGTPRGMAMALPLAIAIVMWAFIWGWLIERFRSGGSRQPSALIRAAMRSWARFVAISLAAAIAQLVVYLTIHPLLFRVVFPSLSASLSHERDAFLVRVALYLVFGVFLVGVSLVADYARIAAALGGVSTQGFAFVRRHWRSSSALFLIGATILGVLFVTYGVAETYGGSRVAGWRGVAIGQLFIVARLALRLVTIAAEVRLYERLGAASR
jgi:hypothetical protein